MNELDELYLYIGKNDNKLLLCQSDITAVHVEASEPK